VASLLVRLPRWLRSGLVPRLLRGEEAPIRAPGTPRHVARRIAPKNRGGVTPNRQQVGQCRSRSLVEPGMRRRRKVRDKED